MMRTPHVKVMKERTEYEEREQSTEEGRRRREKECDREKDREKIELKRRNG